MQPTMQKNNVKQRKTIAIIAMIAVAAIALAAVAIIAVSNKREMTQAASDTCALNAKALATHQESFEEAQQEAEEAAKLTVNDVADGTTLETLKDAITLAKAVESAPACPASGNASDFTKNSWSIATVNFLNNQNILIRRVMICITQNISKWTRSKLIAYLTTFIDRR